MDPEVADPLAVSPVAANVEAHVNVPSHSKTLLRVFVKRSRTKPSAPMRGGHRGTCRNATRGEELVLVKVLIGANASRQKKLPLSLARWASAHDGSVQTYGGGCRLRGGAFHAHMDTPKQFGEVVSVADL